MKIVIDLQGAQSESRYRGIGRYSLALAKAIMARNKAHDIWLILNSRLAASIPILSDAFRDALPPDRIRVFDVPGPTAENDKSNRWRARAAELVREEFLAGLRPDILHVSSLFEGFVDDAVISVGKSRNIIPTAVTLYDLIPLQQRETYLADPTYRDYYLRKAQSLKRADLLLAISQSAGQEGSGILHIPPDRIVNIGAGVDPCFHPDGPETAQATAADRQRLGLEQPFVLYTGAGDPRKNLLGLIAAYALLPVTLRRRYKLAVVGKFDDNELRQLRATAAQVGLSDRELVLLGYVSDRELASLYRACDLFVFPSLHEGFGLPAAEALACGAVVVGSNSTSVPEVIGRKDALFDPRDTPAMARLIEKGLTDQDFRTSMAAHGPVHAAKFTWETAAERALGAFEDLHDRSRRESQQQAFTRLSHKPRMAFVSPLQPQRSGVADYASELLPELAAHYDIICIAEQEYVADEWLVANFPIRTAAWFRDNVDSFDRVVYQFGNSPAHDFMFGLLEEHPGIVILHDFYLSSALHWMESENAVNRAFTDALYRSHGLPALVEAQKNGPVAARTQYPCSAPVIQNASGVLVHSRHAIDLARRWFGADAAKKFRQVPFIRVRHTMPEKREARRRLGLHESDFVVCSFGWIAPTKLNERLLDAWRMSALADNPHCRLLFVGENDGREYGRRLLAAIQEHGSDRIQITGFSEPDRYCDYLASADIAVQLRTMSRGETSGTIFDCLRQGIPLILNAHGAAAEVPDDICIKLPDKFADKGLVEALHGLHGDPTLRNRLADAGKMHMRRFFEPCHVADQYRSTIESLSGSDDLHADRELAQKLAEIDGDPPPQQDLARVAVAIANNRDRFGPPQIQIDVSSVARHDLRTGIERVTRSILLALIADSPDGFRVEPIRVSDTGPDTGYLYARSYATRILDLGDDLPMDEPVETRRGDVFLGLDWVADRVVQQKAWFAIQRARGVRIMFVVHDLLPVRLPSMFPPGIAEMVTEWLSVITTLADGIVCVSRAVADDLLDWVEENSPARLTPLNVGFFHHGADLEASAPTQGRPPEAVAIRTALEQRPSFLMVGTVEPRKAHRKVLDAFEALWADGDDANLIIVGKRGWMVDDLANRLERSRETGRRLFWLPSVSDEMLIELYQHATALLAASEGEGFGLPLIEAARYKLPIVARDIPVFREVAGAHASYFQDDSPAGLAAMLRDWMRQHMEGRTPSSEGLRWQTWKQSAAQLLNSVVDGQWYASWSPATGTVRNGVQEHKAPDGASESLLPAAVDSSGTS